MIRRPYKPLPSAEYVRSRFSYDPALGVFRWLWSKDKLPKWNGKHAGKVAGSIDKTGHVFRSIDGQHYMAHRIAWLVVYGLEPDGFIDHKDGNPANNAISNLRIATTTQNSANASIRADNTSGARGVCFDKQRGLWKAAISNNGRRWCLGHFKSPLDAAAAYERAAIAVWGDFARCAQVATVSR